MRRAVRFLVLVGVVMLLTSAAFADPVLQLYIQGGTYDSATETWLLTGSDPFKLWVIGEGTIYDVKLAAAVASSETGSITLTPTTTGGYGGFTDPSTPGATIAYGESADGAVPIMGDGDPLPTHGIYGPGTSFFEFGLGNFTLTDSPCGDFIDTLPSPGATACQINAYEVSVTGFSAVHFDAFDHTVLAHNHSKYIFAPFSHDAGSGGGTPPPPIPEPGSLLLVGSGLIGVAKLVRKL